MDHSPRFWEVVGSVVPDFRERRAVLQEALLPPME
jgi:predicted metal-dependent hydrolase